MKNKSFGRNILTDLCVLVFNKYPNAGDVFMHVRSCTCNVSKRICHLSADIKHTQYHEKKVIFSRFLSK